MNEIKIKIVGRSGSGKTTIGDIISNYLRIHGIAVIPDYEKERLPIESIASVIHLPKRISALVGMETVVCIEEITTMKEPI